MKKNSKSKTEAPAPTSAKGSVLSQVEESVKENLKVTPSEITDAVLQDAKQAVNYEIRKGFRNLINGFFRKS